MPVSMAVNKDVSMVVVMDVKMHVNMAAKMGENERKHGSKHCCKNVQSNL